MFIEDGFKYHIKLAIEEWVRDHGFDDAEDAIMELDGTRSIRHSLERVMLDRAESYLDVNAIIREVIEAREKK